MKINKKNIEMKRKLLSILFVIVIVIPSNAQESKENSSSEIIELEFRQNSGTPTILRSPMHIIINAYYNKEDHSIHIDYDGELNSEVVLYLNGTIVEYSTEINSSFNIQSSGTYKIEILGESWVSEGYIKL